MSFDGWIVKQTEVCHPHHWMNYYSTVKMKYCYIQQTEWLSREICFAKVNPQYLHIVCINLHNIFEMTNYRSRKQISSCQGLGLEGRWYSFIRTKWWIFLVVQMFPTLTIAVSISWLWHCAIVLQDATSGGNWIKDI